MPTSDLVAIRKTEFSYRLTCGGRTKHQECWAAETADGEWSFERFEEPATPWGVFHNPSVADRSWRMPVMTCGTLDGCRKAVARGWAASNLERCKRELAERQGRAVA